MRLPEADYSEDTLVEQPTIELFEELGWEAANCFYERFGPGGTLGRETSAEVVLVSRLRPSLERLNPFLSSDTIQVAIEQLTRDRSILHPVEANREIYRLLRDGVRVKVSGEGGEETVEVVRVIDWDKPENNDFFLASQFWISGEIYKRRADLLGFVNGLPTGLHLAQDLARAAGACLQGQPEGLQKHHPSGVLVQRLHHPLQRQREPDWDDHLRVGTLF